MRLRLVSGQGRIKGVIKSVFIPGAASNETSQSEEDIPHFPTCCWSHWALLDRLKRIEEYGAAWADRVMHSHPAGEPSINDVP